MTTNDNIHLTRQVDRKYGENWFEELRFNYNTFYFFDEIDDYFCSREGEPLVINQDFRPYQVMLATEKAGLNPSKACRQSS